MATKYKEIKAAFHFNAVGAGYLSGILSSSAIGAFLNGAGAGASIPLATASTVFAPGASSLTVFSEKFNSKIEKHRDISPKRPQNKKQPTGWSQKR